MKEQLINELKEIRKELDSINDKVTRVNKLAKRVRKWAADREAILVGRVKIIEITYIHHVAKNEE